MRPICSLICAAIAAAFSAATLDAACKWKPRSREARAGGALAHGCGVACRGRWKEGMAQHGNER